MTDPDVLFVVLDSLRTDRMATYGHGRETTPVFDRLAERATVYEHAYTPAPWTLPSHCSMFTGRFPSEHGVTNGFTDRSLRLPETLPTVAEQLSQRGYRTAGFSNNPWVGQLSGLDRGFDEYVEWDLEISRTASGDRHRYLDALLSRAHSAVGLAASQPLVLLKRRFFTANLVERAKRWFDAAEAPTFAFMNLMEAHGPYYPPDRSFRELGLSPPGLVEPRTLNTKLIPYMAGKSSLDGETRDRVLEFYDASVRHQDAKLGELVDHLDRSGRFDDSLVVVCADHGKTLGEFDRNGRPPHYLRNVNTNVPLLVKRPGQDTAERVEEPVELTRLFDLLQRPGESLGRPQVALTEDSIPHTGRTATDVTRWRAASNGRFTYLRDEDGAEHLLRGDGLSQERARNESVTRELRQALDQRLAEFDESAESEVADDAEELGRGVEAQLEDLGYL